MGEKAGDVDDGLVAPVEPVVVRMAPAAPEEDPKPAARRALAASVLWE